MQKPSHLLIACNECGLVSAIPHMEGSSKASCPRCGHTLVRQVENSASKVQAYGTSCLVMLLLSCVFPFMSFSASGISNKISLLDALEVFHTFDNNALAAMLLITIIVLPAIYISLVMFLFHVANKSSKGREVNTPPSLLKQLSRLVFRAEIWLLVDIFLVGVIVSLVKIASLADVELGTAFWTYCAYSTLVVFFSRAIDKEWLWENLFPTYTSRDVKPGDTHLSGNHIGCRVCQQINEPQHKHCQRCDSRLHPYNPAMNVGWSWSFLVSAVIFYVPANLYPMMYTASLGSIERSTIMDGVVLLWNLGSYPIAAIIFIASVFVPMTKMLIMVWLLRAANSGVAEDSDALKKLKYYRFTELIGRWSMIDVFVVAILSALVNLKGLMSISPGPAAFYFALVVFFTMCAALIFDPRVFWGPLKHRDAASTSPVLNDAV
ncbi:paraquat-inducible protein A [Grimontia kaedaensis]|uniref:Paraquat-inducible protein A n=1 Tax=Grimontia kaedaensis TaxID=2872157 RepID=A0ABY4X2B0_9GAMM|nr:paraquat-inducible protein A [Grimontia kaedaensis]USH05389.1 paraquat-inducible protein A [Grimontia kaedaensis]